MTSSKPRKPKLKPCSCNQQSPEVFTRWRYVGQGPGEALYHWVQCAGTPPCQTGNNLKDPDEAIKAWNKRAETK